MVWWLVCSLVCRLVYLQICQSVCCLVCWLVCWSVCRIKVESLFNVHLLVCTSPCLSNHEHKSDNWICMYVPLLISVCLILCLPRPPPTLRRSHNYEWKSHILWNWRLLKISPPPWSIIRSNIGCGHISFLPKVTFETQTRYKLMF